jgi:phosphatidylserine decarboxylase
MPSPKQRRVQSQDCGLDTVLPTTPTTPPSPTSSTASTASISSIESNAPSQQSQQSKFIRQASRLLERARSNGAIQKVELAGSRFNDHIRRVRRFSRRATPYFWIEPTALVFSFVLHLFLYHKDVLTNIVFAILSTFIFGEILMVMFSLIILGYQALKAQREESRTISNIRTPKEQKDDDSIVSVSSSPQQRPSKCQAFRPPQVVRWDIIGVTLSNWFGKFNSLPLPGFLRVPTYKLYSWYFGVNLQEIKQPLRSFQSMQDFFTRELKPGVRPIANTPIVSPVDAKLVVSGLVDCDRVEQVKGVTYPIPQFLGEDIWQQIKNKKIYHCVLYLAPGDYHRIHSGTEWDLHTLRHFPGTLFPISPIVARLVPNLFALNERVVLSGKWEHGFFSSTAVGAYHVGSMSFNFDHNVRTNKIRRDFTNPNLAYLSTRDLGAYAYQFDYPEGKLQFKPGDEIGTFKLGSTIVLFFEVPEDKEFVFDVNCGEKVKMGQALGHLK